jgi:hypothetical protein
MKTFSIVINFIFLTIILILVNQINNMSDSLVSCIIK